MFGQKAQMDFQREVRLEIEHLRQVYGADAARIAHEKAARPTNRTARRKVLEEAARQLEQPDRKAGKSLFGRWLG
jgi:hypothetical protein